MSHFEYCNSLFIDVNKTLKEKLEDANHYDLQTIMNMGKNSDYEPLLKMANICILLNIDASFKQSLTILFKCFKEDGPCYISKLLKLQITPYNLRNNGVNVEQSPYNSKFLHGSFSFIISRIWNRLPASVKNAQTVAFFRSLLKKQNFIGCQCNNCI